MKRIEITRGDTHHELITVSRGGQLIDLTGCMLWLTAKHRFSDPDSAAVFQKTMVVGGGIEALPDQAGAGKGKATVTINPADTVALTEPTSLVFDVQLREPDGRISTPNDARGIIVVALDATIATGDPPIPDPGPAPPDVGAVAQWNGALTVWSDFSLPLTAEAGDVGKVLGVTADGVTGFVTASGGLAAPADPADDGKYAVAFGGDLIYQTLPAGLSAPADPGDDGKYAIASDGDITYPSGNRYTGGADGSDGLDTRITAKVETTNATPLTVVTLTPPANAVLGVEVHALVHQAATGDTCRRKRSATWRVDSGTVTRVGAATVDGDGGAEADAGAATWDVTITTSGGNIIVSVVGEAAHTLTWQTFVQFERLDI